MSSQALWYFTRGTGVISLVLLTLSVALGVSEVVRFATEGWPRFVVAALHKNVALLATSFVAAHILTAVADSYAPIRFVDLLVPFVGKYRPMWLGLGTLAFDLLLAVIVTSLLRERIGYRTWKYVHWAAYACWPVAFLHGLGTGSDTRFRWALVVNVSCLALVLVAVFFRLGWTRTVSIGSRTIAAIGSAAVALSVVAWMLVEPMRPGWARKAGTPSTLLAKTRAVSSAIDVLPVPFSSAAIGSLQESGGSGGGPATVTINARLPTARNAYLRVVIVGTALAGGGVRMDSGTVRLGVAGAPGLYRGVVTHLVGTNVTAAAQAPDGTRITLSMRFTLDSANGIGGAVSGVRGGSNDN